MTIQTTYSAARAHLAELWDKATQDRETIIVKRQGAPDIAIIAADELAGLIETAHLLKSPANAQRLLAALRDAQADVYRPQSVKSLRQEVGLDPAPKAQ